MSNQGIAVSLDFIRIFSPENNATEIHEIIIIMQKLM